MPRDQFLHCNDVVPTIYEILGIEPPLVVNGVPQVPLAGASFARTLTDRAADGGKKTQYFEIMGSRAIYHDGWMASAFGPRAPWLPGAPPGIATWTPDNDRWELYHLDEDWSQAHDLADEMPEKLAQMRELFAIEAARNEVLPVGGGLWVPVYHPELRIAPPYREWEFSGDLVRMPEFCAPALGNKNNTVTIEADLPAERERRALRARRRGRRTDLLPRRRLPLLRVQPVHPHPHQDPLGRRSCRPEQPRSSWRPATRSSAPAGPLDITICGWARDIVAQCQVPVSAPLLFTANDCLDIGVCLGSPVSMDYYERAPFPFEGTIERVHVAYT